MVVVALPNLPLTTFWITRTVEINECLLNALVAYADNDMTVWPSNDVQKAMRNMLCAKSARMKTRHDEIGKSAAASHTRT